MKATITERRSTVERSARAIKLALIVSFILVAVAGLAIGCGWTQTDHSIRFNGFRTWREMGRLSFLAGKSPSQSSLNRQRLEDLEDEDEDDADMPKSGANEVGALWDQASTARHETNFVLMQSRLQQYLNQTSVDKQFGWEEPVHRQERRNSAIDQLDALAAFEQGSTIAAVTTYLNARNSFDVENHPYEWMEGMLEPIANERNLKDNVQFLLAACRLRQGEYEQSAKAFNSLASNFPKSEKREAALFLAAVSELKLAKASFGQAGWTAIQSEPKKAFLRLLQQYPHGKYAADARGWLAHLSLLTGNRSAALVQYYRMLGDENNYDARIEALKSLNLVRRHATEQDMLQAEDALINEPSVALVYAYYEISKHPLSSDVGFSWMSSRSDRRVKKEDNQASLARIAAFAERLIKRYPKAAINSDFVLRVAMAKLESGDYKEASHLAAQALSAGIKSDERARAFWVKGIADFRLSRFTEAKRSLTSLLAMNSNEELNRGARENLALIAEDSGDIDGALEHYISLKYQLDVAYLVDVLMTPEHLAGFIARHPTLPEKDELVYGLGVRYLRIGKYSEALKALSNVHTVPSTGDEYNNRWRYERNDSTKTTRHESQKNPYLADWKVEGVRTNWVMQDLQTIEDLQRLEQRVKEAVGDEAKAEALYQLASYQFEASDFLYYNPTAWRGERYSNLQDFGEYRLPNEPQILWEYFQLHEPVAHALNIYLEIADKYPNTRAAKDALYTAAVCHERLSDYNNYWRNVYPQRHAGSRMVTYANVKARYPNYQLPRGTSGWQPSTRTVNNGPGWAAAPRPLRPQPKWKIRLDKLNIYILPMFQRVFDRISVVLRGILDFFWSVIWWNLMLRLIALSLIAWRQAVRAERRFLKELPHRLREPIALLGPARVETIRNQNPGLLFQEEINTGWFQVLLPKFLELKWRLFHTRAGIELGVRILTHAPFLIITLLLVSKL